MNFQFQPRAYVQVTFNDLKYHGRVIRCIFDGGPNLYKVVYSDDKGDIKSEEFYEDELTGREA